MGNIQVKFEEGLKTTIYTVDTTKVENATKKVTDGLEKFFKDTFKKESYTKDQK